MKTFQQFKQYTDQTGVKISLVVTIISSVLLAMALIGITIENEALIDLCFMSVFFEFIYGIVLTFNILKKRDQYHHLIPFLFLNWFLGCFCTNVFINVFENLPIWVYVVTFVFCLSNFFIYGKYQHKYITPVSYFANGFSFLLIVYYMIYLVPLTPFSMLGVFALGLGFYGLVPLIVVISHLVSLSKTITENRSNIISFFSGITIVLVGLILFIIKLNHESVKMNSYSITKTFESNEDVPNYITISQNLKPNFFNEILLKKGIVYESTENFFEFRGFSNFGIQQYNERKTHNPFVNIGYIFCKELNLSADDRINILKSNFDKRLETEEQLWSGADLKTKNIKEDIKIYANNRLAYTEITMDVACDQDTWVDKEAIYSFQLPEGSVATSLSLWVNGVERKGVLTTKEKAEKAYKQIVGVETRDPSIMQWREGNRVVVRVFPINKDLPRTFKCGFTTPLLVEQNEMKYQSLNIKGPNISNAQTLSRIQMVGNTKFEASKDFELTNNYYINESVGLEGWEAVMKLTNVSQSNSFVWKDKVYEVKPLEFQAISFTPSELILDLNSSWTKDEVAKIINANSRKYYAYINNQKQEINKYNLEEVFSQFENLHYSLLPFYKLTKNSLVVTKSGSFSANFEELSTSTYLSKLKSGTKNRHIKVINISEDMNPFWQTLKEQKYVEYLKTNIDEAIKLITENQFLTEKTAENLVAIEPANIAIQESPKSASSSSNGSNHIYRMYAFGKVLNEQVTIQNDSLATNKYVDLAKEANIVTPISSLIVLETDADYEKNGIEKNINTLGNASINNDGSVPEPYEWVLIVVAITFLFLYYKRNKSQIA